MPLVARHTLLAGHPRAAALAAILIIGGGMRLAVLGQRQLVEGDGVHYASLARSVLIGDASGLANPYWSNLWPGVIAATSLATGLDVEGAGRLASLVSGLLLCVFLMVLGTRIFGPLEGFVGGLSAAVHPWLVPFSTLVFTESFFSLLLVWLLLSGLSAMRRPTHGRAALVGVLAGAAALTRPEALGASTVLAAGIGASGWRRGDGAKTALTLGVIVLVFAPFLLGRALLVHRYFDEWDLGAGIKGAANLLVGLAPTDVEKERVIGSLDTNGDSDLDARLHRFSLVGFVLAHPRLMLSHVFDNLVVLGKCARRVLPPLPVTMGREAFAGQGFAWAIDVGSIACLGLAVLGLVVGIRAAATRPYVALCVAVFVVHCLGLTPLLVHERLIVVVVPFFLVLMAHGLVTFWRATWPAGVALCLLLCVVISMYGVLRSSRFEYATERLVQKEAGLWLKERFAQHLRLMTNTPSIAFYFYDAEHQGNEVGLPFADYPALLEYARRQKVDLVAASEWQLPAAGYPTAPQLLPEGDHPGLQFVASVGEPPERVHVFRVEAQGTPAP